LGYPLLQKFGLPATIFLSTAYVHSGDFLPFDRLQLIRSFKPEGPQSQPEDLASLPYKRIPLDSYLRRIRPLWDRVRRQLQEEHCDTLRPLRIEELGAFDPRLIELGAHTHTHAILRNETPQRREQELLLSVRNVREWTGGRVTLFSYPNGEQGDFDDTDKEILQSQGIIAAFSTVPGANSSDCDWMAMKRYSVGLWHSKSAFVSEVTGFRSGLRSLFAKR
jgi:peptidoglycan/xylan/chitin deacetylase (PgdA/CDA1 family)